MDKPYWQIAYEIEARRDWDGTLPLQCAASLFASLHLNSDLVIKRRYTWRSNESEVIRKYIKDGCDLFYRHPKRTEADLCLWIKQRVLTQRELIDLLGLQGIYLSYIVPTDAFVWEDFLDKWESDAVHLLLSGQASFICDICDEDRRLDITFNTAVFSMEETANALSAWERAIAHIAEAQQVYRTETQMRGKYGNESLVQLSLS